MLKLVAASAKALATNAKLDAVSATGFVWKSMSSALKAKALAENAKLAAAKAEGPAMSAKDFAANVVAYEQAQ